jgi:calcium permeable stress-gated cation channel
LDPALTSKTPRLWLPRDRVRARAHEVRESEEAGLKVSDRGAWIDEWGRVEWAKDHFEEVPVWKAAPEEVVRRALCVNTRLVI